MMNIIMVQVDSSSMAVWNPLAQYKINCEVDDPEGHAEGDFDIEVKIPLKPNFESDYWMSGPVIWEMNRDGTVEMSPTETMQTGLVINFFFDDFWVQPKPRPKFKHI